MSPLEVPCHLKNPREGLLYLGECDISWELWWFCFCWFWSNVAIKVLDRNPLEHTEVLVGKRERGIFCQKECWRRSTLRAEWVECGLTLEWWPVEERHWQLSIPVPLWRLLILNQPSQLKRHGYWISGLQKVTFSSQPGRKWEIMIWWTLSHWRTQAPLLVSEHLPWLPAGTSMFSYFWDDPSRIPLSEAPIESHLFNFTFNGRADLDVITIDIYMHDWWMMGRTWSYWSFAHMVWLKLGAHWHWAHWA